MQVGHQGGAMIALLILARADPGRH